MLPVLFVSDFGPFPAVENDSYTRDLEKIGKMLSRPKSIVIMSGHWESRGALGVGAAKKPGVMHDYSGFPEKFYDLDYPCPGDPALANGIVSLLSAADITAQADPMRALDHGVWVPLSRLYPGADIPVVQISVPANEWDEKMTFEVGRALAGLRKKDVLLVGSGALSHNLRLALTKTKDAAHDDWAVEFDDWLKERLDKGKTEEILNYRAKAPHARLAAPTAEHFNPLFFTLGAGDGGKVENIHSSIRFGNGIMRIFTLG